MSFQKIDEALDKAFELIEADRLDEARAILKPILDTEKDNPDVWWLYAHAVTDPETARLALSNVQRLDPNYLNTGDLLYALEKTVADKESSVDSTNTAPSFLPPLPSTLPDLPRSPSSENDDDEWAAFDGEDDTVPLFRRPVFLLTAGLIIFLVIAALVILNPGSQPPIAITETALPLATNAPSILENPTMEIETFAPTETEVESSVQSTPTEVEVTAISQNEFDSIANALSEFGVPEGGITSETTTLGDTLVASVCTEAGAKLRQMLPLAIEAVSSPDLPLPADVNGVAIRMVECIDHTNLLFVGVSVDDVKAYQEGTLDKAAFQAKWQPLG